MFHPVIVANGRERRRVSRKGERGQGLALFFVAPHQFCGHMLRIGGRSAITAPDDFMGAANAFDTGVHGLLDLRGADFQCGKVIGYGFKIIFNVVLHFSMITRILPKMPDTKPMISVIIPTYNRATMLQSALESALAQDYPHFEIIVVDDASTDDTTEMLKAYKSVRVIRHEQNKGAAAARNTGIKAAKGEYVALLDSDDLWVFDKLSRQMAYLLESGVDACVCNTVYRKHNSEQLAPRPLPVNADWAKELVRGLGVNAGSALLVRKSLFDEVGYFDENLPRLEDWEWFIRFVQKGYKFGNAPFNGAIIQVGGAPSLASVAKSVDILRDKHGKTLRMDFEAALKLELAATKLWHGDFIGFTKGWFEAAVDYPPLAAAFMLKRVKRVMAGDAPRFFQLFFKKA